MAEESVSTASPVAAAPAVTTTEAASQETLLDTAAKPVATPVVAAPVVSAVAQPEWFDSKKYKTVEDQAKAYPEARKELDTMREKLKGFQGAPEKYDLTVPQDLTDKLEWLPDDPLLGQFQSIAKEEGMSQKAFERLLHTFAQYEYSNSVPDWGKEKAALGDRADERMNGFWQWAESSLDEETASTVKRALGVWPSPSQVFLALEAVRSGTRQPAIQVAGDEDAGGMTVEAINKKYRTPDPTTKRALIDSAEGHKAYRAELARVVGTADHKVIMGRKAS